MDQQYLEITVIHHICVLTLYPAYAVCHGRHKPLIGQHDTETMTGQTQQLLIMLLTTDVMWLVDVRSFGRQDVWAINIFPNVHLGDTKLDVWATMTTDETFGRQK